MIIADACYDQMINSVSRTIKGRVELLEGSSILDTFTYDGAMISYKIERVGEEGKFFGFGICQKLTLTLMDKDRAIVIHKGQKLDVSVGVGCDYIYPFPAFFVQDVKRNENTNNLEVTAYDSIYEANNYTVSDVTIRQTHTLYNFASAAASLLGMPVRIVGDIPEFDLIYEDGGNFNGTESLRVALDAIAEATQTCYYQCGNWCITFTRLDRDGEPVLHIDKSKYFTLTNKTPITLANICHTTELGDTVQTDLMDDGVTQFIRDNAFYTLRDDIHVLLDQAIANVGGTTITQFDLKWRGNFLLEPFDKISIETKDGGVITTYLINDTIEYNGGLTEKTKWEYNANSNETASNPTKLGDVLKQTTARVDKQNQKIDLVASNVSSLGEEISSIQMTTDSIVASVSNMEKNLDDKIGAVDQELTTIKNTVDAKISAEDMTIAIREELANGVGSVVTETGYKFDADGLSITKSGSEMSTQITDDGMTVFRDNTAVLTANNQGVDAVNLHATTYLIIGNNSRFEDWDKDGEARTACFWIR